MRGNCIGVHTLTIAMVPKVPCNRNNAALCP
jgi:hypothetical protein